jgi:chemotaxis protein CheD
MAEISLQDRQVEAKAINVVQGVWAADSDRALRTILGSCVSVCLYDPFVGVGGMNHFVYPPRSGGSSRRVSNSTFYGDICMEGLLDAVLQMGAQQGRLRAKAFGGGRMFEHEDVLSVGKRNSSYAKGWLQEAGIPLELSDFHGSFARRLIFHPRSGQHYCQRLPAGFAAAALPATPFGGALK